MRSKTDTQKTKPLLVCNTLKTFLLYMHILFKIDLCLYIESSPLHNTQQSAMKSHVCRFKTLPKWHSMS